MNDRQTHTFVLFSHISYTFTNEGGITALHLAPGVLFIILSGTTYNLPDAKAWGGLQ